MSIPKYFKVSQDGIGRWLREITSKDICGLYTDQIDTCMVIIICGEKGITLIHDTGQLRNDAIIDEFRALGKIAYWTVACMDSECLKLKLARLIIEIEKVAGEGKHLKKADGLLKIHFNNCIAVNISGSLEPGIEKEHLMLPLESNRRHRINILNNAFLVAGKEINPDLQFDGRNLLPPPSLSVPIFDMIRIIVAPDSIFATDPLRIMIFKDAVFYMKVYESGIYDYLLEDYSRQLRCEDSIRLLDAEIAIIQKYKCDDLSLALRRAASQPDSEADLEFIISKVGDINAAGHESGKTALHQAVIKGLIANARILLYHGADPLKPDFAGKSPKDYAEGSDNPDLRELFQHSYQLRF